MLKTLKTVVHETVLNEATFYIFLDLKGGMGRDYARLMLKSAVTDMIIDILAKKGLQAEFYAEGYPEIIDQWYNQLIMVGTYPLGIGSFGKEKFVFHRPQGERARFIFFLVGDAIMNKLGDAPGMRLEISNLMFDLIVKKSHPGTKPVVFADGNRIVNLFALKNTG
jgi:hypothetical protein